MNQSEFVDLVREMREAQKEFLTLHTRTALVRARELERRVDGYVLQFVNERPAQRNLFGSQQ